MGRHVIDDMERIPAQGLLGGFALAVPIAPIVDEQIGAGPEP